MPTQDDKCYCNRVISLYLFTQARFQQMKIAREMEIRLVYITKDKEKKQSKNFLQTFHNNFLLYLSFSSGLLKSSITPKPDI